MVGTEPRKILDESGVIRSINRALLAMREDIHTADDEEALSGARQGVTDLIQAAGMANITQSVYGELERLPNGPPLLGRELGCAIETMLADRSRGEREHRLTDDRAEPTYSPVRPSRGGPASQGHYPDLPGRETGGRRG